jgi:hypothetical protein
MSKRTQLSNNKAESQNKNVGENLLATENKDHNIKKEALGPNTKR